jgi:hypothetical protein
MHETSLHLVHETMCEVMNLSVASLPSAARREFRIAGDVS